MRALMHVKKQYKQHFGIGSRMDGKEKLQVYSCLLFTAHLSVAILSMHISGS
jgi:hypothetical protein